ncbi:MAG: phosphoribosylanthranilate isomerase [Thiohalomonadaceae bacterium]
MRIRVKICGITRPADGVAAARLGVDAIGLVFYPPSPRHISIKQAQLICAALPPFVSTVGLFVNASRAEVEGVLRQLPLDVLQFHGDEEADYCQSFGRPYLKALRMHEDLDVAAEAVRYATAQGLLLDTYQPGQVGGTGQNFDWRRVPQDLTQTIILAGGLNPENVAAAIAIARPYAVDVSGGVEQAKGIKSKEMMAAFMRGVESA